MVSSSRYRRSFLFFFFNDTATTEIYTLSLHDALPIFVEVAGPGGEVPGEPGELGTAGSEEHTSELQSRSELVCRLLLEKKKDTNTLSFHRSKNNKRKECRNSIRDY